MNDVNKKWLTIAAGLTLSGALLVMITNQFNPAKQTDGKLGTEDDASNQLVVTNPEGSDILTENESNLNIPSISGTDSSTNTSTSSPAILFTDADGNILETHPDPNVTVPLPDTLNGTDKGTSQTIQPDVVAKPSYTESQLQDPTQTPDGGKVTVTETGEIVPEEIPEPEPPSVSTNSSSTTVTTTPSTSTPSTSTPSTSTSTSSPSADTSTKTESDADGAYVPGFGYVPYNNTPNVGTQATDMYENGNKVGIM
ncbi:MAG: DUF6550 family protein [Eubacteriales bacterium]